MATYTLDMLPASGRLYVYVTGDRYTPESISEGLSEENGWVDWHYNRTIFEESRNNVRPLISVDVSELMHGREYGNGISDTPEEVREEILNAIREVIGYADFSDNGTIYGANEDIWDYSSSDTYMYAVHVFVKHSTASGYVESPVDIPAYVINEG